MLLFAYTCHRVSSYAGSPSTGQFFNKTIETILDRSSPVPVPLNFVVLLECARFSNRVSKTTCASLEENQGISHHIVDMFEEEFDKVQRLLFPGISGTLCSPPPRPSSFPAWHVADRCYRGGLFHTSLHLAGCASVLFHAGNGFQLRDIQTECFKGV